MNREPHCPHCGFGTEEVESYMCLDCSSNPKVTRDEYTLFDWRMIAKNAGFAGSNADAYEGWDACNDPIEAGAEYHNPKEMSEYDQLQEMLNKFSVTGREEAHDLASELANIVRTVQNIKEVDKFTPEMARNYHSFLRSIKNITEMVA